MRIARNILVIAAVLGVLGVGIGFSAAGFVQSGVHANAAKDFLKDGIVAVSGQLKLVTAGYAALTVAALAFLANFGLAIRRACAWLGYRFGIKLKFHG